MVHISKTTKVTTLAQENFFFVLKKSIKWDQNRVSILWSNFGQTDQAVKSAAQGGPDDGHQQIFLSKLSQQLFLSYETKFVDAGAYNY